MAQDLQLICRDCKIEAQAELVDSQVNRIYCSSCGVCVEGHAAAKMHIELLRELAFDKAQKSFSRAFTGLMGVQYTPNRRSKPVRPFVIGKPNA